MWYKQTKSWIQQILDLWNCVFQNSKDSLSSKRLSDLPWLYSHLAKSAHQAIVVPSDKRAEVPSSDRIVGIMIELLLNNGIMEARFLVMIWEN
jgi:hypothetical protein